MVSVIPKEKLTTAALLVLAALWILNGIIPQSPEDKAAEWQIMGFLS